MEEELRSNINIVRMTWSGRALRCAEAERGRAWWSLGYERYWQESYERGAIDF